MEGDEEEGDIVLPGDAAEGGQVGDSDQVAVAVPLVGDAEFLEVGLVVHVPAKHDAAEAKAIFCYGQELLLGHQLAAQHTIHVDTSHLDRDIVLQQLWQRLDGYGLVFGHVDDVPGVSEGQSAVEEAQLC